MHIVVAGMGEVGRYIAEILAREDHNVVAIDADHDALAHAEETLDAMFLHGHAGNLNTLRQAQVERADLFIAVTDNSEAITAAVGASTWYLGRHARGTIFRSEAILVVALSWLLLGFFGGLPFLFDHAFSNPADA